MEQAASKREPSALDREDAGIVGRIRAALAETTPQKTFERFIAANDADIRRPTFRDGARIVAERAAIHCELVRHWAETEHRSHPYDRPFAVAAIGGTGRGEVTPRSDLDFVLLFDDVLDDNRFLAELQRQVLHTRSFQDAYGFRFEPFPFELDDASRLTGTQLNSFLDLRPVYDPEGLATRFLERIRATYDPFEHFLHLRGMWRARWDRAAREVERLDCFDIKHDALRVFLAGIWLMAGRHFQHSHEIYARLEDPRDLDAYYFLLRVRCFVHSRRPAGTQRAAPGDHAEDRFSFADFTSFGEWLGPGTDEVSRFEFDNLVRERLFSARRRVARFARSVLARELTPGRPVGADGAILYRLAGLAHTHSTDGLTEVARSRAALGLLLAAQRYGVPIDPAELEATFRDAGDWMTPVPELSALFYEPRGSLARTLEFLAQFDGALERLFPGYARFETSMDGRVMIERKALRSVIARRKIEVLEQMVKDGRDALSRAVVDRSASETQDSLDPRVEAALLDPDELTAVKLALTTKRLPLTREDLERRRDMKLPLHERLASGFSGVPLASYYDRYRASCEFSEETLRLTRFLVEHRRAFLEGAAVGLTDDMLVGQFASLCGDERMLRSLYVFTCADRADWESRQDAPSRWFRIDELYLKTLRHFRPGTDSRRHLINLGFSPAELEILEDLGPDFFGGSYRSYAATFGPHLLRLAEDPENTAPKAMLLRSGVSNIVGIATRDFRGLAACISGELWEHGWNLEQAHLFSARHYGLALDFFHLAAGDEAPGSELLRGIETAIRERRHIDDASATRLPRLEDGRTSLLERRPGVYLLRHETTLDAAGLVYALAYHVFRHLHANIFALEAQTTRQGVFVSIYLGLPPQLSLDRARDIVETKFRSSEEARGRDVP